MYDVRLPQSTQNHVVNNWQREVFSYWSVDPGIDLESPQRVMN